VNLENAVDLERCPTAPSDLLGRPTSNVAIVTICHQGEPVGMLVTSLASISTQPPLISFSVSATASGWTALEPAESIGVHLLAAGQEDVADRFSSGRNGFAVPSNWPSNWRPGPDGVPILDGCAAWSVARPQQRIHAGSHVIIVARLLQGEARAGAVPLLTQADGNYRLVS
jgi:flavin reductase (DIM6/NTAB) family NADH-FMN oxidoreductase RutF